MFSIGISDYTSGKLMGKAMNKILIAAFALAIFSDVFAGNIRSASGSRLLEMRPNGDIRSVQGTLLGRINQRGEIRLSNGKLNGRLESDGEVRNAQGVRLGKIEEDGRVRDNSGVYLGQVRREDVRDRAGKLLGRFEDIDPNWVALYFFFNTYLIPR